MSDRFTKVLHHGAVDPRIDRSVIAAQLATAEALRTRLDEHGGVILGDEVGAGKTYVTFALLVEALSRAPRKGAVIFVPNQLLVGKWCNQLKEYLLAAPADRQLGANLIERITPINRSLYDDGSLDSGHAGRKPARNSIIVATHGVYSRRASEADRAECLRAAARRLKIGRTIRTRALLRACGIDPDSPPEWASWAQPDRLTAEALEPLRPVLNSYASGQRKLASAANNAVRAVRLRVGQASLPDAALVVIDEAHNLKSTQSEIYKALMAVLSAQFDGLLFLTATPFQLGRGELLNVVDFFKHARAYSGREEQFKARQDHMRRAMDGWMDALDTLGSTWRDLDPDDERRCIAMIEDAEQTGQPGDLARIASDAFAACLAAKSELETAMRPFLVRSVRERGHREHGPVDVAHLTQEARIPLALVDRLLVEMMQRDRTFVASALISACSSWESLLAASIMKSDRAAAHTRSVLQRLASDDLLGAHPKVAQTVAICWDGIQRGEKTLVFVEREQTGRMLRDSLLGALAAESDDRADRPSDAALLARLQDRSRFGWPSLRENYLHTIYPLVFGTPPQARDLKTAWLEPYATSLWARVDPEGEKRRYDVEKRFWEHVLFRHAAGRNTRWADGLAENLRLSVESLLEPNYILNGLDLWSSSTGGCTPIPSEPVRTTLREPRMEFAAALLVYPSPWILEREALAELNPDDRAEFVDAVASAIATSHFRHELESREIDGNPAAHFKAMEEMLLGKGSMWRDRFSELSVQARDAARSPNPELASTRMGDLISALGSNVRVQYIDGSTQTSTKQNAIDGFNTPLYPEVIIATPVLGEGLDLHRFCRRVIHHDLPWNPAKLEQRTGRVDRVGSLSERLGQLEPKVDSEIDVWLPFVPGTYDEFIHDRVMARRREFRCILGNKPEWQEEVLGENEEGSAIDDSLVQRLQVRLSPS